MRMHSRLRRLSWLIAASALVAGTMTLTGVGVASASTCQAWASGQPPTSQPPSFLNAVSVDSACDVWAVGSQNGHDGGPLIEHWTGGASWTAVPSPVPSGGTGGALNGVKMTSATDGWAVGDYHTGSTEQTLILHWNGVNWTPVSAPSPSTSAALNGVTAVAGNDVWAVGLSSGAAGQSQTLILHWDGSSWQQVASPDPGTFDGLTSVSALTGSDVWAVGSTSTGGAQSSDLALHWNGTAWSQVSTSTTLGTTLPNNRFNSVSAAAPNDVWAVGEYQASAGSVFRNVIEHWNGSTWNLIAVNFLPVSSTIFLNGVLAGGFNNAWAVGSMDDQPLLLHWNGAAWSTATAPTLGSNDLLAAIGASSNANLWTVGNFRDVTAFAAPVQLPPQNVQVAVSQLNHSLYESGAVNGTPGDNLGVEPATSPAVATNTSGQSEIAWTGSNGDLWVLDPSGNWTDTGKHVAVSSSPGIAALPNGGFEIVFTNADDGLLWQRDSDGTFRRVADGLGVAALTSPVIAADASGKFDIAFHANATDDLWIVVNNVGYNTALQVAGHSSPAIAALEIGGYELVFTNRADGLLWEQGPDGIPRMVSNGLRPEADTSPAVAADGNGGFEIALHGDTTDDLWTVTPDNTGHDMGQKVLAGTSPGIAALPGGGFQVAFQSSGQGAMELAPNGAGQDAGVTMAAGTSPGISAPATFANAVLVPNVLSMNETNAEAAITAAGLTVGTPSMDNRCLDVAGAVLGQDPAGGARAALGSTVKLTVSSGRDSSGKPCVFK